MMKVGHQLLAVTTIAGGVFLAKNLSTASVSIQHFANIALIIPFIGQWMANHIYLFIIAAISAFTTIPIVALFHTTYTPLIPDGDGGGAITRNIFLAPGFWILRFFVSHRGFTHDIRGIISFGFICYFLSLIKLDFIMLIFGTLFTLSILWCVIEDRKLKALLSIGMVFFAPILLSPIYWNSFLIAIFIGYVIHMFGDAPTDEGWTIIDFAGFKIRIILPFAFEAGGWFEKSIIYPVLLLALAFFVFNDFDFWKLKTIKEIHDLLIIYKTIILIKI